MKEVIFIISKAFTLTNKSGFHMRPAQVFVKAMARYSSDIKISFDGREINGKSIISIMAAGIKSESKITVYCNGKDEEAMLCEAAALIESGFGEG